MRSFNCAPIKFQKRQKRRTVYIKKKEIWDRSVAKHVHNSDPLLMIVTHHGPIAVSIANRNIIATIGCFCKVMRWVARFQSFHAKDAKISSSPVGEDTKP